MDVLHEVIVSFLLVGHTGNEGSLQNDNSYDKVSHQNELFQKLLFITNWVLTYNQIWFTITEAGFVFNTILKSILNAEIFVYTAVYFLNIFHSVLIHTPSQDNYKEG